MVAAEIPLSDLGNASHTVTESTGFQRLANG